MTGNKISELDNTGARKNFSVYMGGSVIAQHANTGFSFKHADPEAESDCRTKAFLDTIAWAEGADYRTVVLGTVVSSPNFPNLVGQKNVVIPLTPREGVKGGVYPMGHPNIATTGSYKGRSITSTAAGRYQFLYDTWTTLGFEKAEFDPANQDAAATLYLAQLGILGLLANNDLNGAIAKAKGVWTSLPGSTANQGTPKSLEKTRAVYQKSYDDCIRATEGGWRK